MLKRIDNNFWKILWDSLCSIAVSFTCMSFFSELENPLNLNSFLTLPRRKIFHSWHYDCEYGLWSFSHVHIFSDILFCFLWRSLLRATLFKVKGSIYWSELHFEFFYKNGSRGRKSLKNFLEIRLIDYFFEKRDYPFLWKFEGKIKNFNRKVKNTLFCGTCMHERNFADPLFSSSISWFPPSMLFPEFFLCFTTIMIDFFELFCKADIMQKDS